jgi:cytochrome P450
MHRIDITALDRRYTRNCNRFHGAVRGLIQDRRDGKIKSWKAEDSDILSALMRSGIYPNDQIISDECAMMFLAGSKTIQASTSNLIMYLCNNPEIAKKLQAEIDSTLEPIKDDPMFKLTLERADESFEYLMYCYNESLRIETPVSLTFRQSFT